ncbi:hypothetical protein NZ30_07430 [Xanthomonas translucens pv. undulosa]|nr:hypothetical protein NZ30_07430 [Xanthomonas translucens pv. undulosa]
MLLRHEDQRCQQLEQIAMADDRIAEIEQAAQGPLAMVVARHHVPGRDGHVHEAQLQRRRKIVGTL